MSLTAATFAASLVLIVTGAILLWNGVSVERMAKAFPRSPVAAVVVFGGAALWFLWGVLNLGPADFGGQGPAFRSHEAGDFRQYLVALFAAVGLGAFFVARDFLAVRGFAILILLAARHLLDASFYHMQLAPPGSRVVLNAFVYVAIVVALYVGAMPYQMRDFFLWLWPEKASARPRIMGAVLAGYGLLLAGIAASY